MFPKLRFSCKLSLVAIILLIMTLINVFVLLDPMHSLDSWCPIIMTYGTFTLLFYVYVAW